MKLVAIIMILILSIMITSCDFITTLECSDSYYTHYQFLNFVNEFNSDHNDFIPTYISVDFDTNQKVASKVYNWNLVASKYFFEDKVVLTDKRQGANLWIEMFFYLNDVTDSGEILEHAYQIQCCYYPQNFNFYQEDEFVLKYCDNDDGFYGTYELEDVSTYDKRTCSSSIVYSYVSTYNLCVNGSEIMTVYIASSENPSEEELSKLCDMLMDSIVIINVEV